MRDSETSLIFLKLKALKKTYETDDATFENMFGHIKNTLCLYPIGRI
jgi:hypothetical protein